MTLARGFLAESEDLRRSATEPAGASALFVDTFRLVAGIVLIAVAEDRDLLHPMWVPLGPRRRYAVELSVRRPPAELRWSALERLSTALKAGDPEVGLAAIATGEDGGLLNSRGVLERATIADAALSAGILALAPPDAPQRGARWAALAMGLGQVYEQLQGLVPVLVRGVFDLVEPARASGSAHRHDAGAYYTPAALVDHMLDTLLDPPHDTPHAVAVLDPSCGSGNFLLAAAQRIAAAQISGGTGSGGTGSGGTGAVYGVDIDPVAVELCRASLWLLRGQSGLPLCTFDHQVRCADALLADWEALFPAVHAAGGFDVIVGNPPYLNQLETGTAASQDRLKQLKSRFGASKGAYTDEATLFLLLGLDLLGPGGRMALLHPLSLLAARDAEVARSRLASSCSIGSIWLTTEHIFAAASVYVCAVTFHKDFDRPQGRTVTRSWGNEFRSGPSIDVCMDDLASETTWGHLVADLLGIPRVVLKRGAAISDVASTTADFRDQFYGLVGTIIEDDAGLDGTDERAGPNGRDGLDERAFPKLIVTGSVDPATCRWGERPCTFAGASWRRPRVDLRRLDGTRLQAWAETRLVPKLVIATQTRVIEAFADPDGTALNTVPTITLIPHRTEDLWRLLAVLLAPPVSAWALSRYVGTALSMDAIKLSAKQIGQIPLPSRTEPWDQAALLVQRASGLSEPRARARALAAAGALMCDAYEVEREPVLAWWTSRLPDRSASSAPKLTPSPTPKSDGPAGPDRAGPR